MSKKSQYSMGNACVAAPAYWLDVTEEIEDDNPPFTLARRNGAGVIQFSNAAYKSGRQPEITLDVLYNLLTDFAQKKELGSGYNFASHENVNLICAASFDMGDRFLRVWYCSNGQSITLVTYNCQKGVQGSELHDCEWIVHNLKFV
jgi:hypothetical protein